jgi:DNA processing protein
MRLSHGDVPTWAHAAALAALPLQTHTRLRRLLASMDAEEAWFMATRGMHNDVRLPQRVIDAWRGADEGLPQRMFERCVHSNIAVVTHADAEYPTVFRGDPAAPAVLFYKGSLSHVQRRRVAIIGTRHATRRGRHFASEIAAQLSRHGVAVVSGLARGIDVAAHTGIREHEHEHHHDAGPPIAVVASGVDVIYPREHAMIWKWVCENGLVMSEAPPGTRPEAHLFPLRNRILACISEIVVVIESGVAGGSMITVREAEKRNRPVMAVPGAPGDEASVGTNALLRDGCAPVTDVSDVLLELSLDHRNEHSFYDGRELPTQDEQQVLSVLQEGSATVDTLAFRLAVDAVTIAVCLGRLENKGWVAHDRGWWEALTAPHPLAVDTNSAIRTNQ